MTPPPHTAARQSERTHVVIVAVSSLRRLAKVSAEESFLRATSKAALSLIRKELDDITEPVLDDTSVYEML